MDKKQFVIGIDIGTTTSKGCIVDAAGNIVAQSSVEHGVERPFDGWAEHDAEEIWWSEFRDLCSILLQKSQVCKEQIKAIGCSSLYPTVLAVDKNGNPLRKAILYGIDSRAIQEIETIINQIGKEDIAIISGNYLSTQSAAPKMLWIKNNEPEVYERTAKFVNTTGYIVHKLTGKFSIDVSGASMGGVPYQKDKVAWNTELCAMIGIDPEKLPPIYDSAQVVGGVTEIAAQQIGVLPNTPVICGSGDFISEMLSVGVYKENQAVITYGTTIGFAVLTTEPVVSESLVFVKAPITEISILGGGLANGASLLKWFKEEFMDEYPPQIGGKNVYDHLDDEAATIAIGSDGLMVLPFFSGERHPFSDPNASGLFVGLTLRHTKAHIYRGLYEALGYSIRSVLESLAHSGFHINTIVAVGGATKSPELLRIVSDICNVNQVIVSNKLGAQYGVAFLAALGVRLVTRYEVIDEWLAEHTKNVLHAQEGNHRVYTDYYQHYKELYNANCMTMHSLKALSRVHK